MQLTQSVGIQGSQPLYSRVPTHDENGKFLADFMILISGLREWPGAKQTATVDKIHGVLNSFTEVVFADLNVPLNLLWVSIKPKPGLILEVYDALKHRIPEAVIIGPMGSGSIDLQSRGKPFSPSRGLGVTPAGFRKSIEPDPID